MYTLYSSSVVCVDGQRGRLPTRRAETARSSGSNGTSRPPPPPPPPFSESKDPDKNSQSEIQRIHRGAASGCGPTRTTPLTPPRAATCRWRRPPSRTRRTPRPARRRRRSPPSRLSQTLHPSRRDRALFPRRPSWDTPPSRCSSWSPRRRSHSPSASMFGEEHLRGGSMRRGLHRRCAPSPSPSTSMLNPPRGICGLCIYGDTRGCFQQVVIWSLSQPTGVGGSRAFL